MTRRIAGLVLACLGAPVAAQQASFQIIPTPASFGNNVQAVGVSADGTTVIGEYFLSSHRTCTIVGGCTRTFRWTAATGAQDLGVILDKSSALAYSVSADGSQIVGAAYDPISFSRAFIWTPSIGMQDLGTPIFTNDATHGESEAYAISANGSTIAGRADPNRKSFPTALVFTTEPPHFSFLPFPAGGGIQSDVQAVSADGAVQVGNSFDNNSQPRAIRWQGGVPQDIGGNDDSTYAVSSDGSVVVGTSNLLAFRWTQATGLQSLGSFGGQSESFGQAVSADGSVVVGTGTPPRGGLSRAFRWTAQNGFEDLNTVLANLGVNTNGWQLVFASGLSADGTAIVGMAEDSAGANVPYLAVVPPPVCAPVTCASLGKNCGTIPDGCGGTLTCGACNGTLTCGGGGVANVCGPLKPTTSCVLRHKNCGAIPDGVGGWLACGACVSPEFCGGAGTPNVCGAEPPVPASMTFNPTVVTGGNPSTGTVTLTVAAPAGGALVKLNSDMPAIAKVPANVTVPAGMTSANFTITTTPPKQNALPSITACYDGQCVNSFLFVNAP